MAGADNLIGKGFDTRSTEEVRQIAAIGGVKSGETRRRKREFKQDVEVFLDALSQRKEKDIQLTNQAAIIAAVGSRALRGDVKAAEFIRDTVGEKPIQTIEQHNTGAVGIGMFEGVSTEQLKANLEAVDRLSQTQVEQLDE